MAKRVFIGAAWPYANGSLHLGHVAGLIGADILARYYRLRGVPVLYVSGSDCHGTPIALEADRQGVEPREIANRYHQEFVETLVRGLNFSYDVFTTTTTDNHQKVVQKLFLDLYEKGHIFKQTVELPYCPKCERFLPDRYIEGKCPECGFEGARGDQCDECGTLLDAKDLINPKCSSCGTEPIFKPSEHFFLQLETFRPHLNDWVSRSKHWRANAKNFTLRLLEKPLPDRAITRDTTWGVPIPLNGYEKKSIYVWFEAVTGYLSAAYEWATMQGKNEAWHAFWEEPNDDELIHYYVHGKDNIPFHTVIWPAILLGYGGLHLPDRIISSEYLTLEHKQFSKSRHWAVWLPDFLKEFESDLLRYYLVMSGPETADSDFSWQGFQVKVNKELIGHFGNLVHRIASLVHRNFLSGVGVSRELDEHANKLIREVKAAFGEVGELIEVGEFRRGLGKIFELAEETNRYLDERAPWHLINEGKLAEAEAVLAVGLFVAEALGRLVEPYLPTTSGRIRAVLGLEESAKALREWVAPTSKRYQITQSPEPIFKPIEDSVIDSELQKLGQKIK